MHDSTPLNTFSTINNFIKYFMFSESYEDIQKYEIYGIHIEILLHLLFLRQYNLLWTLAFDTILPSSQLSLAIACLLFIPIIFKMFSTLSHHLLHGLPLFLIPSLAAVAVFSALFCFAFSQHEHPVLVKRIL